MSRTALRDFSQGNLALGGVRIHGYDSPLAANPNDLALILNLVLALLIGLYYAKPRGALKWVVLTAIALSAASVVVTFSRGGFLTLLAIAVMVLIKRIRERVPAVVAAGILRASVHDCRHKGRCHRIGGGSLGGHGPRVEYDPSPSDSRCWFEDAYP